MAKERKGFFETRLMSTKIKSQTVSLFPEAGLGYLLGPILALLCNGVVNIWLIQYWDKVLGLGTWNPLFETLLPIVSSIVIVIGNLFVGKLMERKPSLAGKARPLILIGMPIVAVALLLLFLVPFPGAASEHAAANSFEGGMLASIFIAVGYVLYFAIAWPLYFTSHSALVNLSTRDSGKRGLLGTAIMAAQLAAAGVSGMAGGLLVDLLGLLPVYKYTDAYILAHKAELGDVTFTNDFVLLTKNGLQENIDYTVQISRADANGKWTILMIVMIVALVVGCLLEYFFTRERITEEAVRTAEEAEANKEGEQKEIKKVTMGEQIKICMKDKFWWMIMIFWFLYQFSGQMKNNDMSFFSQAMTGGNTVSSIINTVGAIPTALGMLIVWPLANKLTKAKAISLGGLVAGIAAAASFSVLAFVGDTAAVTGISVASFCVKALGTAPAMYISIALMANVLDHQEAVHGVRTDGFTMAVYGSLMVALPGICNGIILGLNAAVPAEGQQFLHTLLAFGTEGICYLIIAALFLFMNVEKFTRVDNKAIVADQKATVLASGGEWVEPEERAKQEQAEIDRQVEEARIEQLKATCEKKGLNFEEENNKFLEQKAQKLKTEQEKKEQAELKKKEKLESLTPEQRKALEEKAAAQKAKQDANDEAALAELNKVRESIGRPVIA